MICRKDSYPLELSSRHLNRQQNLCSGLRDPIRDAGEKMLDSKRAYYAAHGRRVPRS